MDQTLRWIWSVMAPVLILPKNVWGSTGASNKEKSKGLLSPCAQSPAHRQMNIFLLQFNTSTEDWAQIVRHNSPVLNFAKLTQSWLEL